MKILIFDTETTGLAPGYICQLSYIIRDNEEIIPKNFYFKVNYIEPGAQRVHGLSVEMLERLSGNKKFIDHLTEIKSDFESADIIISHNYEFDKKFLLSEFTRCKQEIKLNRNFCTMKYFTDVCKLQGKTARYKYPRLEELARHFDVSETSILKATKEIFCTNNSNYHDARFDVVTVFLCCIEASKHGHLKEVI